MDSAFSVPSCSSSRIHTLLDASPAVLKTLIETLPSSLIPWEYIDTLTEQKRTEAFRLCLLAWEASSQTEIPRENQLQTALSMLSKQGDVLVVAGTGSGKTLIMVLLLLMQRQPSICITISPLQRLQITQAQIFNEKYKIPTLCINDDTPRSEKWWKDNIYDFSTRTLGTARHLIVTTEQSFTTPSGHLPRMGQYLRNSMFRKDVPFFFIDEIHTAHYAGIPRYGLPPFRKTWGRLSEIKSLFPDTVPWLGLTATCPPHVQKTIEDLGIMRAGYELIKTTVNRPNTIYATLEVKSLDDVNTYRRFIDPDNPLTQKRVLVFCNKKTQTVRLAKALSKFLPDEYWNKGIIRHYHGGMSKGYLEETHKAFTDPDGSCRILFSTSGESVGVDFRDVWLVVNDGLPGDMCDSTQRGGRVVRILGHIGLYLILYEAWAADPEGIKLADYHNEFGDDPDRPRTVLTEHSNERVRAGYAPIRLIHSAAIYFCIRKFLRDYHNDTSLTALDYNGPFCCDRHRDGFNLEDYLPGPLYPSEPPVVIAPPAPPKRNQYRPMASQRELIPLLTAWRRTEHENDDLRAVSPEFDILSDKDIKLVARWRPNSTPLASSANIMSHLEQTEEWRETWGTKLFRLLFDFDLVNPIALPKAKRARTTTQSRVAGSPPKRARSGRTTRIVRSPSFSSSSSSESEPDVPLLSSPPCSPRPRLIWRMPVLRDITNNP